MPYFCNERGQWVGIWEYERRGVLLWFWRANLPVRYRVVQSDRGPTGNLRATREESPSRTRRSPKYPRRTLVGEMLNPWKERQGLTGSQLKPWKERQGLTGGQLGKESIESSKRFTMGVTPFQAVPVHGLS